MSKIFTFNAEIKSNGKFVRTASKFRNFISSASGSQFPAEPDRYTLFLAWACPWCHRTDLVRKLKGLEDIVKVTYVDNYLDENGWRFGYEGDKDEDSGLNASYLKEIYLQSNKDYEGKITVPVLYDRQLKTIVNNESSEIIKMFNTEFNHLIKDEKKKNYNIYPSEHQKEIDELNQYIYNNVNNGVYKCGFAQSQEAYNESFHELFNALDELENRLSKHRYLIKGYNGITECDIYLLPTLLRFDPVYYVHFKCNLKSIQSHYPNLYNYLKDIYQFDNGILKDTFNLDQTKKHYYGSHRKINPFGIVPLGPLIDYDSKHNRDNLDY
ncbi:hypothetical protein ABK040_001009 [Willaertia magna]